MRILSGVQSNRFISLGNYYGAIKQWIELQDEGAALYFVANLHALTSLRDGAAARELTLETAVALLALGLDPRRVIRLSKCCGAIKQWIELQDEGEALYLVADVAALAALRDGAAARELTLETAVAQLALGLDPRRAILFRQSDIPEIPEMYWVL